MAGQDLLLVAGEASGDLHGARLLAALRRLMPDIRPFGLGAEELRRGGLEAVAHSSEIAVVGISEALKVLPRARRIFSQLLAEAERRRPAAAVLIDFAEFNLRLAAALKRRGVRVVYYIPPQVWAWRRGRVRRIGRDVDRALVVFPFEETFYRARGVEAVHVGHPLVDEVPRLEHVWDRDRSAGEPFSIALLPGSRRSEIRSLLPLLIEAAVGIAARLPARFRLLRAPTVAQEWLDEAVAAAEVPIEIVSDNRFEALADSHLALCASGTATLEVALIGTPMLVTYRVSLWSYLAGLLLVRLPYVSLVNLVLADRVVPELLQREANADAIAAEALDLLASPDRVRAMRRTFAGLRQRLGPEGASLRAAEEIRDLLKS